MKTSVQKKLLRAFITMFCIAFLVTLLLLEGGLWFLQKSVKETGTALGANAADSSAALLEEQAVEHAADFTAEKAEVIDAILKGYGQSVTTLAGASAYLYDHSEEFSARTVSTPAELSAQGAIQGACLQWLPCDEAALSNGAKDEAGRLANLQNVMAATAAANANINSLYVVTASGACLFYDGNADGKKELEYSEGRTRDWYLGAQSAGGLFLSAAYEDLFDQSLTITLSAPVKKADGTLAAVCGMDISVQTITDDILATTFGQNGRAWLLSAQGGLLAAEGMTEPEQSPLSLLGDNGEAVLADIQAAESGHSLDTIDGQDVYVIHAPVALAGWKLVLLMPVTDIIAAAQQSDVAINESLTQSLAEFQRLVMIFNIALLAVILVMLAIFIPIIRNRCRRIATPIMELTEDVRATGEGALDYHSDIHTGDEIELLSQSFENMNVSLRQYIENLTRLTAEKERIGAELNVATQIQRQVLPCTFPPFPQRREFDLYATMTPAKEVGGDFYDFYLVDDDHLALVMADVSGKGVPAALFMMTARTLIKALTLSGKTPSQIFAEANNMLNEGNSANMFITAWLGILTISEKRLVYVNAGHNPPLLKRSEGGFEYLDMPAGFILAGMEGVRYYQFERTLEPGATLFLYTDGVVEAADPAQEMFGELRLQQTLNHHTQDDPKLLLRSVKTELDAFTKGAPQADDVTMLALHLH